MTPNIAWWLKMSLEMHLCLKEWSHNGPFEAHQSRGTKTMESRKSTGTTRKTDLILFYLEIYVLFLASYDGVFIPRGRMQKATFLTMNSVTWSHLVRMQCSSGGTRSVSLYSGHSFVVSLSRERWITFRLRAHVSEYFWNHFFVPLSLGQFTSKRRFPAPKTQLCKTLS